MVRTAVGSRERVNLYLDRELFIGLKGLASLKNMTYSELIRRACYDYILAEGPKALAATETMREVKTL